MNARRLLAHYEAVADAPDAIPRLRRFVLNLAVRGKLVPQDPNDEPASELLKRIAAEKAKLVKAGEIEPSRGNVADEPEPPFQLPPSWQWSVVEAVAHVEMGQSPPSEHYNQAGNGIAFFQGKADFGERHPTPRYWCTQPTKLAEPGDILLSVRAPVGPTNVANERCCIGRGLAALRPFNGLDREFILKVLNAFEEDLAAMGFGTTFVAINKKQLTRFPLPIPPIAEQRRIVAKADELMALCGRLEAARAEREAVCDRLTAASLARLDAPDPETFFDDARFALDALRALTARADQVRQLRQTIINLAVNGKLVPQDPDDEPALAQIARIAEAKSASKGRKGARAKGLPNDADLSEGPAPTGWVSVRLDDVAASMRYGTSIKCDYDAGETPVVRIPNVSTGRTVLDDMKYGPLSDVDREALALATGDLLMIRSNGSLDIVGRSAVVTPEAEGMAFAGYLVRLRTLKDQTDTHYIWLALNSSSVREQIERPIRSAVGLKNVNLTEFGNLSFWLAPVAEQRRIVAKVDELMALCDQLEASLATGESTQSRLLDALVADALAPTKEVMIEALE